VQQGYSTRSRGFTLLEVMVAIAILGLTLTVILSAQGGLAASNKTAANMGVATSLGRCKMTEIEEKLLKLGYPEIDDLQTDISCCDDKDHGPFTCDTRVEKVVLPNPPDNTLDGGAGLLALTSPSASASAGPGGLPGPLGGLAAQALGPAGGAGLDFDGGGLQNLGQQLTQQMGGGMAGAAGGASGLLSMVMGIVYPSLKPMMETSIRRLTVTVKWREGPNKKELGLVQYVTNPMRAGFVAGAAPSGSAGPASSGGIPTNGPQPGGFGGGGFGSSPSPFGAGR
jgi:general secretion pathway protein I